MKILMFNRNFFFDNSNGASVAHRDLGEFLRRRGVELDVCCGINFRTLCEILDARFDGGSRRLFSAALPPEQFDIYALADGADCSCKGRYSVFIDRELFDGPGSPDSLASISGRILDHFKPDIIVTYGGDSLTSSLASAARDREVVTVFWLHNFNYKNAKSFDGFDRLVVPSQYCSDYYRDYLGLKLEQLSYLLDPERFKTQSRSVQYLTFVNPSVEKGVYPFARIADELGRRRPDIPLLVVESRGTESTVAACGLELRDHGTVHFMGHTADPREFWGVTKVCLLPSLWWENQPLVAVEAMANGIPVIGSDRGGIPETLGDAGIVLPLPDRITQATRMLPTAEEVEPWVQAVIRLWDDAGFYEERRQRALVEARRWEPEVLGSRYIEFFDGLKPGPKPKPIIPPGRAKSVVLVPYLNVIERECEEALRGLEAAGVRVVRSGGNSAIDVARNRLASEALHDGAESLFFVDSDIGFDPRDALRLLARPEPVVAGVYAKKGNRSFASIFADGVDEVVFGAHASGLYPLKYAATGFLRFKAQVLRRLIEELDLPHCNTHWGKGDWPFFQPFVVPQGGGRLHYLGEDWAFSHRLAQIGVTPMADTSIRLWHYGRHAYGWEDVGFDFKRFATLTHRFR